jgi:hypothetical protein
LRFPISDNNCSSRATLRTPISQFAIALRRDGVQSVWRCVQPSPLPSPCLARCFVLTLPFIAPPYGAPAGYPAFPGAPLAPGMAPPPGLGTLFAGYSVAMWQLLTGAQVLHQACPLLPEWHRLLVSNSKVCPHKLIDQAAFLPPSSRPRTCPTSTSTPP